MSGLKLAQAIAITAIFVGNATAYSQIAPITRQVEDVVNQRVTEPLRERLRDNALERIEQGRSTVEAPVIDVATIELPAIVTQTTRDLNGVLTVTSKQGAPLFNEVQRADGTRVIEHEWLIHIAADHVRPLHTVLQRLGADLKAQQALSALGMTVVRFKAKPDFSPAQLQASITTANLNEADRQALAVAANEALVPHFVYAAQAEQTPIRTALNSQSALSPQPLQQQTWCEAPVKIGMVDSFIDQTHQGLANSHIIQQSFVADAVQQPQAHGTAVAGLFVANQPSFASLTPHAELFNGAVFYRQGDMHQGAALLPLLEALNWLAEQQVQVINLSLTGPANALLHAAIQRLAQRNILLVAAAGNDGPAVSVAYPAAYDEVVAVTAVDANQHIYRWANRGADIELAALGVRVQTTRRGNQVGIETGTSMAVPVVTAAAACAWFNAPTLSASALRQQLHQQARDIGETGRDPIFGYGLLGVRSESSR